MADDQVTQTGEKSTKALSAKLEKVVERLNRAGSTSAVLSKKVGISRS